MTQAFDHLHTGVWSFLDESEEIRITRLYMSKWVSYARASEALARMEHLLRHPPCGRMPSMLLYGDSDIGKTMVVDKLVRDHPNICNEFGEVESQKVLRLQMPSKPNDDKLVQKLEDIVGLYMSPPEHALVLCCDEKSQVQALDRTQPGLPIKKGRAQTMTHDYKRHGTTTLFAALNVLDGQVIGQCQQRHTHVEWLKFLRQIDRETPKGKTLHLIADNYATHKHPVVQDWLAKHPRFNMHFTPTSASWLNMVERFFRDISENRLRRGVFTSVPELVTAIDDYVAHHNTDPKPFIWTKSARDILQKVIRANSRLSSKQNGTLHELGGSRLLFWG